MSRPVRTSRAARPRLSRLALVAVTPALIAATAFAGSAHAATAAGAAGGLTAAQRAAAAKVTHPERDFMGSTVAKHEGVHGTPSAKTLAAPATTAGHDVSHYQGSINWASNYSRGARFVYMKTTEGTSYRDPNFSANYTGSYNAGYIRGAYHFALPNNSSGAVQANYFADHGGGWSKDGKTLPGLLDIEYNPYGATCYGLSQGSMVAWIDDFVNTYHARTGRWAVIYTTTNWWTQCTGNNGSFGDNSPLMIARYSSSVGALPAGWGTYTIWQYNSSSNPFPGDNDTFNGAYDRVQALANG